jgi:membrane-associated phospholipid phosphatase
MFVTKPRLDASGVGEHLTAAQMSLWILIGLPAACVLMLLIERAGIPTTLQLKFKGDIKRESHWLSQYGQFVATVVAMFLIFDLDEANRMRAIPVGVAVGCTSLSAFMLKRMLGRVRPNREQAGQFLGPCLRHENYRESFPSSHSACAVALTVMLAHYYPHGTGVFWGLAILTASLRYLLDAHWPSDILAGMALGYAIAWGVLLGIG